MASSKKENKLPFFTFSADITIELEDQVGSRDVSAQANFWLLLVQFDLLYRLRELKLIHVEGFIEESIMN